MPLEKIVALLVVGAVLVALVVFMVWSAMELRRGRLSSEAKAADLRRQANTITVSVDDTVRLATAVAQQAASPWHAMPGNRLELADTGFYIVCDPEPRRTPLYRLYAPEHWLIGGGSDLPTLKSVGERYARERAEFACKPIPVSALFRSNRSPK